MCGFNGIFAYSPFAGPIDLEELLATRDAMAHRGPDGAGTFVAPDLRLGFGHRRLSIIDLSDRANQPMASPDGKHVVVFNGEIYNFRELRAELLAAGYVFRTTSDTEVLLHLYRKDGPGFVRKLRGMFAFALWDQDLRGVLLARDPYGIKPLYISDDGWTLRFASESKAILAGGHVSADPEPAGIVGFFLWGSVPEPFTVYRSIRSLPAGTTQWIDSSGPREVVPYDRIEAYFAAGADCPIGAEALGSRVREAVLDSVRAHLVADVEVGVFLSAGIDSGALMGAMRDVGQDRITAITLTFAEYSGTAEDETPLAKRVAQQYGAEHIVRIVDEAEFQADLPSIFRFMDQPSIDGVNTWFVAKAAREAGLKVALSGVGGDELFAGYPSFTEIPRWVRGLSLPSMVPGAGHAWRVAAQLLGLGKANPKSLGMVEYAGSYAGAYLLRRGLFLPFELRTILDVGLVSEGLRRLEPLKRLSAYASPRPRSPISHVAALESSQYLRNQLLRDSDWAGMAHSLEIRTPLVDIALLRSLASAVPRTGAGQGKRALGRVPSLPLPSAVVDRAKTGFSVPIGKWMANALDEPARVQSKGAASRDWARRAFSGSTSCSLAVPTDSKPGADLS